MQPFTALAAPSHPTAKHESYSSKLSGKIARAFWSIDDEANEIHTDVFILVADANFRPNIYNYPTSAAYVAVDKYRLEEHCVQDEFGQEYCYYEQVPIYTFFGVKEVNRTEFRISDNLGSASLDTTITSYAPCGQEGNITDYCPSEKTESISVDASWQGYGETFKSRDRYSHSDNYQRITQHSSGFFKDANASVKIVGDDIALNLGQNDNTMRHSFPRSEKGPLKE